MGFWLIMLVTIACLFFTFKRQQPRYLLVPFILLFAYVIIQIALVPLPFWETVKFIFSLS